MNKTLATLALLALAPLAQATDMSQPAGMPGGHMEHMQMKSADTAKTVTANGTVKKISPEKGTITIAHDPVAALGWPAMVMPFKATAEQMQQVKEGDAVTFTFDPAGMARLTSISVR